MEMGFAGAAKHDGAGDMHSPSLSDIQPQLLLPTPARHQKQTSKTLFGKVKKNLLWQLGAVRHHSDFCTQEYE
jgi:hypothetical protein